MAELLRLISRGGINLQGEEDQTESGRKQKAAQERRGGGLKKSSVKQLKSQ